MFQYVKLPFYNKYLGIYFGSVTFLYYFSGVNIHNIDVFRTEYIVNPLCPIFYVSSCNNIICNERHNTDLYYTLI